MQSISKSLSISSNCILFSPTFQIFYLVFEIEKISNKELTIHLHLSHQILFYESFLMCRLFVINVLRTSSPYFLSIEKRWQTSKVKILFEVEKSRIRSCLTLVKRYSSFLNGTSWVLETITCGYFFKIYRTEQATSLSVLKGGLQSPKGTQTYCLCFALVASGSLHFASSPGDFNEEYAVGREPASCVVPARGLKKSLQTSSFQSTPEKDPQSYKVGT